MHSFPAHSIVRFALFPKILCLFHELVNLEDFQCDSSLVSTSNLSFLKRLMNPFDARGARNVQFRFSIHLVNRTRKRGNDVSGHFRSDYQSYTWNMFWVKEKCLCQKRFLCSGRNWLARLERKPLDCFSFTFPINIPSTNVPKNHFRYHLYHSNNQLKCLRYSFTQNSFAVLSLSNQFLTSNILSAPTF